MSRPQVTVNVTGALPDAIAATDTGVLFFVYAGAAGPATPTVCRSAADAVAASVPTATAAWVGDAIAQGATSVIVLRATAEDAGEVTEAEWDAALAVLTPSYGPGQVAIPGVSSSAAYSALLTHAAANPARVVLLDVASGAAAAAIETAVAAVAADAGAERAAVIAPWVVFPQVGGGTRSTPGSVVAAGLAARSDAATGSANNAPIFDQGRNAGRIIGATGLVTSFTDDDVDDLYDAGVNVFRLWNGVHTLTGWRAASPDLRWKPFGVGRLTMQLSAGVDAVMSQYLGRPIDGKGYLFAEIEGALTGYLQPLHDLGALYGATPAEAFGVVCDFTNNSPASIAAGVVNAAVAIKASSAAEQIVINVITSLAA